MIYRCRFLMTALGVGVLFSPTALAQEKKLTREQLPPAVEKTVAKESQGATIKGFSSEVEKRRRLYEAELVVNGHSRDVLMDGDGNIVEIEEQVELDSLPQAVQAALKKEAGSGRIAVIESLTKNGKLVAYEAQVKHGKKRSEIQVGPNGEKLKHPV
ncbi:MAG TPA: hypothetical protein VLL54_14440 [Pyrinomonadaceae bacterium]|nr:hypothetical protein [Pyrinomonadaceae bacterium]